MFNIVSVFKFVYLAPWFSFCSGFVHTYLLQNQPVEVLGVVCNGLDDTVSNTIGQMSPTDKSCFVYQLLEQRDTVIVQCNTDVKPEQAFSWTKQVVKPLVDVFSLMIYIIEFLEFL